MIWMGTRCYDSVAGRFISPDPAGHAGSMDLYSYANGNPVVYCDPDGRFASAMYEKYIDFRSSSSMGRFVGKFIKS